LDVSLFIVLEHVVKLDVVDLVGGTSLESLVDELVLSVCYPQLHVVKDASESGVGHVTAVGPVFVLEERLDQQASVLHVSSDSAHDLVQLLGLPAWQHVPWVQDRGHLEFRQGLRRALLKVLLSEDLLDLLVEVEPSHLVAVLGVAVEVFQLFVLLLGQLELLSVEDSSELGGIHNALSQGVVILEELA